MIFSSCNNGVLASAGNERLIVLFLLGLDTERLIFIYDTRDIFWKNNIANGCVFLHYEYLSALISTVNGHCYAPSSIF